MYVAIAIAANLFGLWVTAALYRRRITPHLRAEDIAAVVLWPITLTLLVSQR